MKWLKSELLRQQKRVALNIDLLVNAASVSLLEETIKPRANLLPLLVHLRERHPVKLHYIGVSFGLILDLFRFWRKHNFIPFYIGQIRNVVTGEHTCMVLRPLNNDEIENGVSSKCVFFEPFYQGMQNQDVTSIKEVMKLEREQILSIFIKVMKKLYNYLYSITAKEIDASLPRLMEVTMAPYSTSVDEDLDEAAEEVKEKMKADNEGFFNPELLQQYAIVDKEGEFEKALRRGAGKVSSSGLVSVKSSRSKMDTGFHKKEKRRVRWRELILKRRETDSVLFGN